MKFTSQNILYLGLLALMIGVGSYFGYQSTKSEEQYRKEKVEYAGLLEWKGRLANVNSWLYPNVEWEPKRVIYREKLKVANEYHSSALVNMRWCILTCLVGIGLILLVTYQTDFQLRKISLSVLLVSIMLLVFGVISPMMEMEAYKDDLAVPMELEQLRKNICAEVAVGDYFLGKGTVSGACEDGLKHILFDGKKVFEGRTYFFYQSKSALGVMDALYRQGNYFVMTMIVLFSFIIPFLKLTTSIALLYMPKLASKMTIRKTIGYIGKLSMGDVFVVSMYLAYMSFYNINPGYETESHTLVGIYFFSTYVLLSVFSYFLIERHIKVQFHDKLHG